MTVNKYSDWSDRKINMIVTDRITGRKPSFATYSFNGSSNLIRIDEEDGYCSDGRLMVLLMQKYKIGLISIADKWLASPDILTAMNNDLIPQAQSYNPCRAVAECFLLIGDDDKEA